jgi:LDH2 family malate/lactate/ureidoglycolate dehydrogenase
MSVLGFGEVHITTRGPKFKCLSSKLERTGEVTAFLDGDNGLGQVSVWHAMSHAIEITKDSGLSLVGI